MPAEPQQQPSQNWTAALVAVDDLIGPYPALVSDARWNGWAIPRFTLKVVQNIAHDTETLATTSTPGEVEIVRILADRVEIVREVDRGGHLCEEVVGVVDPDHDGLYPVGARAWAWSVVHDRPSRAPAGEPGTANPPTTPG